MGAIDRSRLITIKVPRIQFVGEYNRKLQAGPAIGYSFLAGLCIITLFVLGGLSYAGISHVVSRAKHPPKVVTKTIYQSALTAAQQAYIKQCKEDVKDAPGTSENNNGVPDVHSKTWTCTFPQ